MTVMAHTGQTAADLHAVARMWRDYVSASGYDGALTFTYAFGDSPELADELADLVRRGRKRATASLLAELEHDEEPVPAVGDRCVVLDGQGQPVAVVRTTEVVIKPLAGVDAAFARDEAEGDGSLGVWVDGHHRYFRRRCESLGIDFSEDLDVVFERFEQVWPPTSPDPSGPK
jgi:uncharacterized protein YhfF